MKKLTYLLIIFIASCASQKKLTGNETIQDAIAADRNGNHATAISIYEAYANRGDSVAMVTLGMKYQQADGASLDYEKAMSWYLKAMEKGNGDAINNIGVMYRDGQGVEQNKKIAYLLFLAVHMNRLGTSETQLKAGKNLSREITEQPKEEIQKALCLTQDYFLSYVRSQGKNVIEASKTPTPKNPRIKDNGWWLDSEKKAMNFNCANV